MSVRFNLLWNLIGTLGSQQMSVGTRKITENPVLFIVISVGA